jgi:hypothetical protein
MQTVAEFLENELFPVVGNIDETGVEFQQRINPIE